MKQSNTQKKIRPKVYSQKQAIFPGSFDPLTNGHLDIIQRSLTIFDRLTVAVLENSNKIPLFTVEERLKLIKKQCTNFKARIEVKSFSGLLVDFAKQEKIYSIVRGLRAISDYDYEVQMGLMNKNLFGRIETVFLIAREENSYISSSIVKEAAILGANIEKFVPDLILKAIQKKLKK